METRQIEKQLNRYVPDLNVPFEDLQKQLAAFIQAEREQLKARILKGGKWICGLQDSHGNVGCSYSEGL